MSVVECWGRKLHCSSGRIPASSRKSPSQLATILRRTLPACATRERPLQLLHSVRSFFLSKKIMVASFHSCGTSLVIHTATIMPWNASKISCKLSESPNLSSSAESSSGPIALPLAIDLRAFFASFTTGGYPSDRASGFGDRPSIIVRLRAPEVVLSKEAKYRLHLARISSSLRRRGQSKNTKLLPRGNIFVLVIEGSDSDLTTVCSTQAVVQSTTITPSPNPTPAAHD